MKRSLVLSLAIFLVLILLGGFGCGGGSSSGLNTSIATVVLSADPISIPADNISYSTITAVLTAGTGFPPPIGTPVLFSTTLGVFSNSAKSYSTTTIDEIGTAKATLIAGLTPGTATVTGISGDAIGVVKVEIMSF